jgi:predicted GNAT family acetyltransferase
MRVERCSDVETFLSRVGPFLAEREAEHNLILGICSTLSKGFDYGDDPPYLGFVEERGRIVMATVRTPPWGPVLSLVDNPGALDTIAGDLNAFYGRLPGVHGPTDVARSFVALWQSKVGQTPRLLRQERIYRCDNVEPVPEVRGFMRTADEGDRELLLDWMEAFDGEAVPDQAGRRADHEQAIHRTFSDPDAGLYLWIDDEPVSMAGYGGRTPNGTRITAVFTPPRLRRRGYATALVGQLTKQVLEEEDRRYCFLFTDVLNPTSNSIYQRIGYQPVVDVDEYAFE